MVLRQLTAVTSHLADWQLESFSTASPHVRALELNLEIGHHGQKNDQVERNLTRKATRLVTSSTNCFPCSPTPEHWSQQSEQNDAIGAN